MKPTMEPTPIKETKTVTTEEIVGVNVPLTPGELTDIALLMWHFPFDIAIRRFGLRSPLTAAITITRAMGALGVGRPYCEGMEMTIRKAFEALDEKNERDRPIDPDIVTLTMNRKEAETFRRILGAMTGGTVEDIGGDSGAYTHLLRHMNLEIERRKWSRLNNFRRLTAEPISWP